MGDGSIDRDDQVEVGDQRSGVGEVGHLVHEVDQREGPLVASGRSFCRLKNCRPDSVEQGRQPIRAIDRRRSVARLLAFAGPCQADPQTRTDIAARRVRQASTALHRRAIGGRAGIVARVVPSAKGRLSIGQCRSNGGSSSPRATTRSTPGMLRSRRTSGSCTSMITRKPALRRQRGIAAELHGVAEALLGMDQQRPPLCRAHRATAVGRSRGGP